MAALESSTGLTLPSAGKPPRAQLPPVNATIISESSLGRIEPFAEGASAVLFRAKVEPNDVGISFEAAAAAADQAGLGNAFRDIRGVDGNSGRLTVAVKLARSREGQIHDDVEAELKLLHAMSRTFAEAESARKGSEAHTLTAEEMEYDFGDDADDKRAELVRGGASNLIKMIGAGLFHDLRRFLVFEYCASTLEALLDVAEKPRAEPAGWPRFSIGGGGSGGGGAHPTNPARPQIGMARALKLGFELCLAVSYLHTQALKGHVVVHRDIKPSNIGLTETGSVRLLDLGLARAVPKRDMDQFRAAAAQAQAASLNATEGTAAADTAGGTKGGGASDTDGGGGDAATSGASSSSSSMSPEELEATAVAARRAEAAAKRRARLLPPYEMTGYTGSLRYMAPEVATNQAYDESVDVYSLALVLWEVASLERPYKGYNKAKFFERVVRARERPALNRIANADWPPPFKKLLAEGWNHTPHVRPSSSAVSEELLQLTVEQRYRDTVTEEDEQFHIPPLFDSSSMGGGGAAGIVKRLSEMALGTRRGSEFINGERKGIKT